MHRLHLPSLQFRRVRADLMNTFRIVHQTDNVDTSMFLTLSDYGATM
jgi:hypothetical protein